jgi:phenylalanyl-tRNA synthetase beta chain
VGKIRGVESFGMMASERELELSDEHDGIIELPSGEVGESFADWLGRNDPSRVDPVIEIKITPNRPDALGIRGISPRPRRARPGTLKPLPRCGSRAATTSPSPSPSIPRSTAAAPPSPPA